MGAVEVSAPNGFQPAYSGYKEVWHYDVPGHSLLLDVYIWSDTNDDGFSDAATNCELEWDGSDGTASCYGSSNECKVVRSDDGDGSAGDEDDWRIVCCDDC